MKTKKVVINGDFGGFSISRKCAEYMAERGHETARDEVDKWYKSKQLIDHFLKHGEWPESCPDGMKSWLEIDAKYRGEPTFYGYGSASGGYDRTDPLLVAAVEALGEEANGTCARLKIVEIPKDVDYVIEEYDGLEHVAEAHRTWD